MKPSLTTFYSWTIRNISYNSFGPTNILVPYNKNLVTTVKYESLRAWPIFDDYWPLLLNNKAGDVSLPYYFFEWSRRAEADEKRQRRICKGREYSSWI